MVISTGRKFIFCFLFVLRIAFYKMLLFCMHQSKIENTKLCKLQNAIRRTNKKQNINFLPVEITTAHSGTNIMLRMSMTELPSLNIFINFISTFLMLNLTLLMAIFVEQPDKTLLDWCENKWINHLNAKININIIVLPCNCD